MTSPASPATLPATAPQPPEAFGAFRLGALPLALPMRALREVLPCTDLRPLACPAACVIGGIALRGVTVPVVDLRLALGRAAQPLSAGACVIVMVEAGCILGLLADAVTGVFSAPPEAVSRMQLVDAGATDAAAAVLAGTVRGPGDGVASMVLSPAALARLPQVPMVVDPEPERQHHAAEVGLARRSHLVAGAARPVMLMRCGNIPLAIDAMGVHATLALTQVLPSPLAMGHCRGVIVHDGQRLPLVDLLALCGLGRSALEGSFQAFLVRLDAGLVAFAVDEVVDVVRVADVAVVPVPAFALPQPGLFAGALPMAVLPDEVVQRAGTPAQHYLVLDARALKAHADVAGLAGTNTPCGSADGAPAPSRAQAATQNPAQAGTAPRARRNMVTYLLGGETATPIEQVAEILPHAPESAVFAGGDTLLGLVINRGRSIPVLCLSRLCGLAPPPASAALSVLVVESAGAHVGFAVTQLRSIDTAEWPLVDAPRDAGVTSGPLDTRTLARVGSGATERLLPVLDLQQLARSLQGAAAPDPADHSLAELSPA